MRTLEDRRREQARASADDRDLESRTDRRRQQDARETLLKALATRLVNSKRAVLERLELDEELAAAVATAQAIRSAAARNRQINVVRQHLRALGPALDALVRRMDDPTRGRSTSMAPQPDKPAAAVSPAAQAWIDRLAEQGDRALEVFMRRYPAADRQPLRQCARELGRARADGHPPMVARAEARLYGLLEPLLEGGGDEAFPPDGDD